MKYLWMIGMIGMAVFAIELNATSWGRQPLPDGVVAGHVKFTPRVAKAFPGNRLPTCHGLDNPETVGTMITVVEQTFLGATVRVRFLACDGVAWQAVQLVATAQNQEEVKQWD